MGGFGIGLTLAVRHPDGWGAHRGGGESGPGFRPGAGLGQLVAQIVYWVGPILGGVVAGLLWEHVLLPTEP